MSEPMVGWDTHSLTNQGDCWDTTKWDKNSSQQPQWRLPVTLTHSDNVRDTSAAEDWFLPQAFPTMTPRHLYTFSSVAGYDN